MRNLALADLADTDLRAMLAENETLFVEHKAGLGSEAFQVAKAVCSFANMLGGWVLIGVTHGEPNFGRPTGWKPVAPHELTDRVRQALATNRVDPVPPFAATVVDYGDPAKPVGVVRVYESSDTPHVMGNGQVFVRSVAEDRDVGKKYRPGGVETQAALLELAARGRDGVSQARKRLDPDRAPLAAMSMGISSSGMAVHLPDALVGLRAIPVTVGRFPDWAVSRRAHLALERAARNLARRSDSIPLDAPGLHASGLSVSARSEDLTGGAIRPSRDGVVTVATDAAGVVVATIQLGVWEPARAKSRLTLNGIRDLLFEPLLRACCSLLEDAEALGRVILELRVGRLETVIELDDEGGSKNIPTNLPLGAELNLPLSQDGRQLADVANHWRADAGRAAGYMTLL